MTWNESLRRLQELVPGHRFQHQKTERNAATTAWGVDWDETLIARDILQNFFDANRDDVSRIQITTSDGTATIAAPSAFNLERLFFFGSEKTSADVGHYGEGFKVAITCLLKDHEVTPISLSGDQALVVRIDDEPVKDTQMYPLIYDFFSVAPSIVGTRLLLSDCGRKLLATLKEALWHFYYPENPLIGKRLWSSGDGELAIFESTRNEGYAFYRNLRRGEIAGIPLVLCMQRETKTVETRIRHDRDRKAFGEKLLRVFYKAFAMQGLRYDRAGQRIVVEAAKPHWQQGHALLSALADTAFYGRPIFDEQTAKALFGNEYFAHCISRNDAEQLRLSAIEHEWERAGKRRVPGYFERFGLASARSYLARLDQKAQQEARQNNSRPPSPAEQECIVLLQRVLHFLAPPLSSVLERKRTSYTVALTEVVLGELRSSRDYRSLEVYLAASVFTAEFSHGLAVFLHEHSHVFGHDGSRAFTDALTDLLETVVQYRSDLGKYEAEWDEARRRVQTERKKMKKSTPVRRDSQRLQALTEQELRELLSRVPPVVLDRFLRSDNPS